MRISRITVLAPALGALVAAMSGCKKEGPAERAGNFFDNRFHPLLLDNIPVLG